MSDVTNQENRADGKKPSAPAETVVSQLATMEPPEVRQRRRSDYNRLARTAKLTSILLEKLEFTARTEAVGISKSLLKRELNANATVLTSGITDGSCIANIQWGLRYTYQKRTIVKCIASYIIGFEGMKEFSEEVVGIFVDTNAKAMTYPYFRGLYAHLDWSANLGSAPLPIVQLQAKV
jgi:hypothetical protein